jgi:dTDP-4-amino-4,6-dideoxygalactose transaminase
MIRIAQPMFGRHEEEAALAVLRSGALVQGEEVARFEQAFASHVGAAHAVAVSSGTAALIVALRAQGIGPGDEVIVPTFTFAATASAVLHVGAKPVLVDITPDAYAIDPARIEAAVTEKTRAIIPVHLYGHPCDMTAIRAIAERHGLVVIEDACQALGAAWEGERIGSSGTACFSFYATKAITTAGEGGMITTDDDLVARRARLLRSQGEAQRYVTQALGWNYRMTELAAAVGLAQLPKASAWIEQRRANAAWLNEHLAVGVLPVERLGAHHVYQQYTIRVAAARRDQLVAALRDHEIEAVVYYPLCIHEQPLYRDLGYGSEVYPVAEAAAREVLSLPVHPALSPADLQRVADAVNRILTPAGAAHG